MSQGFETELQKRQEIERIARLLCKASTEFDPDMLFVFGEPIHVFGGHLIDTHSAHPLWTGFVSEASAVINDQETRRLQEMMDKQLAELKVDEVGAKLTDIAQEAVEIAESAIGAVENWKDRLGLK